MQAVLSSPKNPLATPWYAKLFSAILLFLVLFSPSIVKAQSNTCTATFENLPEQPIAGKEYDITVQFSNCPKSSIGTVQARNVDNNNSKRVLGSVYTVTGTDKITFKAEMPPSGKYVLEGTNLSTNNLLPYVVSTSPVLTVLPATTPNPTKPPTNNPPNPTNPDASGNVQNPGNAQTNPDPNNPGNTDPNTGNTQTPDSSGSTVGTFKPLTRFTSIGEFAVGVINFAIAIIGALALLFIIIGGVRMVVSAGNESAIKAGKKTVTWAVIGLVVALLSFTLISALETLLGRTG
jgi:hypothetical protein